MSYFVKFQSGRNPSGRGYWKFPEFLVNDKQFKSFLKDNITELADRNKDANPALLWDTIKCGIRGAAMFYMKNTRKERKDKIELTESTIAELVALRSHSDDEQTVAELTEDINLLQEELSSAFRTNHSYNVGRKEADSDTSSKYFFKKFAVPGSISMLFDRQDVETKSDSGILDICSDFYQNLYSDEPRDNSVRYDFIPKDDSFKISEEHFEVLSEDITKEELYKALKAMRKDTAPGLDGLTVSFMVKFWDIVGNYVFQSLQYAFQIGKFSVSQRRGVIKLLPKKSKNPHFVRNLRPITLLNIDYKLVTKALATRLRDVLDDRILNDQNAFIKRRYIGSNIIDLYSIIAAAEENDEDAMLILLDIEKAFDTINWEFINQVLKSLGFPPSFLHWIKVIENNKELRIFNNGHSSKAFKPRKGVAQGCALSPLIYILAMETLANVLRSNPEITGVKCGDREKLVSLAADDTLLSILATEQCMEETNNVLDAFSVASGLKVNYSKSIAVRIGSNRNKGPLVHGLNFAWLKSTELFTYLGLKIRIDGSFTGANFDIKDDFVSSSLALLRYSFKSLYGKVCIIKTLVASKFVYKFSLLPTPPPLIFDRLDRLYYDYLWEGRRHRIAKTTMEQNLDNGGFKMINCKWQSASLKLSWPQKLLADDTNTFFWMEHVRSCFLIPMGDFVQMNIKIRSGCSLRKYIKSNKVLPRFWYDVFALLLRWTYVNDLATCSFAKCIPICFNSALGKFVVDRMLPLYVRFKQLNIFSIQEFLETKISVKRKLDTQWFEFFDTLPTGLLEDLEFGFDKSPFADLYKGGMRPKDCVELFRRLKPTRNNKAIQDWATDLQYNNLQEEWTNLCHKAKLLQTKNSRHSMLNC